MTTSFFAVFAINSVSLAIAQGQLDIEASKDWVGIKLEEARKECICGQIQAIGVAMS